MPKTYFLKNKQGHRLKTPVIVNLPEAQNETERKLQEYIVKACMYKIPRLMRFIVENKSMLEVAKHLFLHNSESIEVLETYALGIRRFCNWANTTPDELIELCTSNDLTPNQAEICRISGR